MDGTVTVIYRPNGRTDEYLLHHIEDFAEMAKTSRREVDRMIADGDLTKVKVHGATYIPAEYLSRFPLPTEQRERPERRKQQAGGFASGPEAEAEPGPGSAPATPWEELSYDAR